MEFREKLVYLRNRKGVSRSAAAEQLKVAHKTLERWERGDKADVPSWPDLGEMRRIADYYEVTVPYLVDDTLDEVGDVQGGMGREDREVLEKARRLGADDASVILSVVAKMGFYPALKALGEGAPKEPPAAGEMPNKPGK